MVRDQNQIVNKQSELDRILDVSDSTAGLKVEKLASGKYTASQKNTHTDFLC